MAKLLFLVNIIQNSMTFEAVCLTKHSCEILSIMSYKMLLNCWEIAHINDILNNIVPLKYQDI